MGEVRTFNLDNLCTQIIYMSFQFLEFTRARPVFLLGFGHASMNVPGEREGRGKWVSFLSHDQVCFW
jgi:hypothetical protein